MTSLLILGQILMAASMAAFVYGHTKGYGNQAVNSIGWGLFLLGVVFVTDFYVGWTL